jgi:hypothetical protein
VMSAEVLEVGWLRVTLVEMTSPRERARPAAQMAQSDNLLPHAVQLSSRSPRQPPVVAPHSPTSAALCARVHSLHARMHSLSMRVCSWHAHKRDARTQDRMATWHTEWHGHRDGMDTGMTWTQGWHGHRMAWTQGWQGHLNTRDTHDLYTT